MYRPDKPSCFSWRVTCLELAAAARRACPASAGGIAGAACL